MKGPSPYIDLGSIFDEIFEAAKKISTDFQSFRFDDKSGRPGRDDPFNGPRFDENVDYYPTYSYPPLNVYMNRDRSLTFEFAIAGFSEKDISLAFQGDYMTFSAKMPGDMYTDENVRYFKRRLKLKDIEKQKYFVPQDKFDQASVKAGFKNGILKVSIPPRLERETPEGVKIEIMKEGD